MAARRKGLVLSGWIFSALVSCFLTGGFYFMTVSDIVNILTFFLLVINQDLLSNISLLNLREVDTFFLYVLIKSRRVIIE